MELVNLVSDVSMAILLLYASVMLYHRYKRTDAPAARGMFITITAITALDVSLLIRILLVGDWAESLWNTLHLVFVNAFLVMLIFAYRQVEKSEADLERTVEERTQKLMEAERLANIGRGVMMAEREIRNPLALINQATYAAEKEGRLNGEMIDVIRGNVSKIGSVLRELRERGEAQDE